MINYSIEVLEREKYLLNMCLSTWDEKHYPEARKEREKKLNDINNALKKLKMIKADNTQKRCFADCNEITIKQGRCSCYLQSKENLNNFCYCEVPEVRSKCSENGIDSYCIKCLKTTNPCNDNQ